MKVTDYLMLCATIVFVFTSCQSGQKNNTIPLDENFSLFKQIPAGVSGLHFVNELPEDGVHNIFNWDYYYNGAGVAVGDIDNDGLSDIFFTGNVVNNKLYLNRGNLRFQDISQTAGIEAQNTWCNGSTMVDINLDGFLDIYVNRSYFNEDPERRRNLLFINNQDNTFTERAFEYGLADSGHSTQTVFFDYDLDGDLDAYVGNHPGNFKEGGELRYERWLKPELGESDRLYRNNGNGRFTDVTEGSGLMDYSFTLGIVSNDFNGDGWPDLFVSNDYAEPDRYYINNGDGTFTDELQSSFGHISMFGMGTDAQDINNDGLQDIINVDMLAEDNYREKTQMSGMAPATFWMAVDWGFHYQYMRNSLHLNSGNGTFSEIGQMAGVHRTDWSWGPLLADFDNDGWKDLYITNGFRRDSRFKDVRARNDQYISQKQGILNHEETKQLLEAFPSTKMPNYLYRNNGDYTFKNISQESGISTPSFSNGGAYADFDNDGDLDLVVNNLLDKPFLFKNQTIEAGLGNYLRIQLNGKKENPHGFGAKVDIFYESKKQSTEHTNVRGYLSSMEFQLHFGLGEVSKIDRLEVRWPDGKSQEMKNIKANQSIVLDYKNATENSINNLVESTMFSDKTEMLLDVPFKHEENSFNDYDKQVLLPHKLSQFGPAIAVGDINGDELEDFFIGGASGQAGAIYLQTNEGKFILNAQPAFTIDIKSEDVDARFIDVEGDGDLDLYVVSGGNAFAKDSRQYQDRIYINNDSGTFTKGQGILPELLASGSCVESGDYDNDGDMDLFVGGRHTPWEYPETPNSYLLENQEGKFIDVTEEVIPELKNIGMVTSAVWVDLNKDAHPELIVAGEWMPIRCFDNSGGSFNENSNSLGLSDSEGWWNCIEAADLDGDGDQDIIAGNLGLNYKYKASPLEPFHLYSTDFDENGQRDIVLAAFNKGNLFPVRGRQCSSEQIPDIKEKFDSYDAFGKSTLSQIYGDSLQSSDHFKVNTFASVILKNEGNQFSVNKLPPEAQFAPVNGIIIEDFNRDNKLDVLLAGNLFVSEVETGRADAGKGLLLIGGDDGQYEAIPSRNSGFWADQDVKKLRMIKSADGSKLILVANNNDELKIFLHENIVN
jgi:hypothetical protein